MLIALTEGYSSPIVIAPDNSKGARIGGTKPEEVNPKSMTAKYFCTLCFEETPQIEISIFLNFDFSRMVQNSYRIIYSQDELVEVLLHNNSMRSETTFSASQLSPCALQVLPAKPDVIESVEEGEVIVEVSDGSKIGGKPYIRRSRNNISAQISDVVERGFVHFAQLAAPLLGDAVLDGNWPFGLGSFNLFVKQGQGRIEWCCCWQH